MDGTILLFTGLVVVCAGIILSVYEEWSKSGLTDTSYASLFLWIVGLATIACWGLLGHYLVLSAMLLAPIVLFSWWILLKLRDARHRCHGKRR